MKIIFAVSEAVPYIKTGGLADVAGSLPLALGKLGHKVMLVLPLYRDIPKENLKLISRYFTVEINGIFYDGAIYEQKINKNLTVLFIRHDGFFDRDGIYGGALGGYLDNPNRFIYFNKAVLEAAKCVDFSPHIIHCHDWQTGLIPPYLKNRL